MKSNFASLVFWSINGKLTKEELQEQMGKYHTAGVGGVIFHARAGLKTPYMSDEWLDRFGNVCESAKKLGMTVVIYDENGWPSGFAGGVVNGKGKEYQLKHIVFSKKKQDLELFGAYTKRDNGYVFDENGKDLYAYVKYTPDYVDLTSKKVTKAFIESTHEKYKERFKKYFGTVITGLFTDEPQYCSFDVDSFPYSLNILDDFKKRTGYDLKENIWRLYVERNGDFRYTYLRYFSQNFFDNYTSVVAKWCEKNKIDYTGHLPAEDGLVFQSLTHGGVMRHYSVMQRPGVDYLGRRFAPPVLFKQLESVKNQFDKQVVLSESFAGAGWGATLNDYARLWANEAVLGVNQLCTHLGAYSIAGVRKRDYPGFFSYQQPWFRDGKCFTEWVENTNIALSSGQAKNRIAVISPVLSAMHKDHCSEQQKAESTEYRNLITSLLDAQLDFDIVDEDLLAQYGKVQDGKLILKNGKYDIVVCMSEFIEKSTADLIKNCKCCFVNKKPVCVGYSKVKFEGDYIYNRREALILLLSDKIKRYAGVYEKNNYIAKDFITTTKFRKDGSVVFYVVNMLADSVRNVYIKTDYKNINVYDVRTEKELKLDSNENGIITNITFAPSEAKMFILRNKEVKGLSNYVEYSQAENLKLTASMADLNTLTVDYASYSLDGKTYTDKMDIVRLAEEINGLKNRKEVFVKYTFTNKVKAKIDFTLCAEDGWDSIEVNGKKPTQRIGYFIDKCIKNYDITPCIKKGENTVILKFTLQGYKKGGDETFETMRNIFFFDVEPESIYVRGDFSVINKGKTQIDVDFISEQGPFEIVDKKPVDYKNFTLSGGTFYRGNLRIDTKYVWDGNDKIALGIEDMKGGNIAKIYVNDKFVCDLFLDGEKVDVTKYSVVGQNAVKILIIGSNRNCLGAFHHYLGEVKMTGRNTFEGHSGFEDFVNGFVPDNVYTKNYSFIPFGVKNVKIFKV